MIARGAAEIADDIALVSGCWTIVVHAPDSLADVTDELRDELAFAFDEEAGDMRAIDAAAGVASVIEQLKAVSPGDVAVIEHAEALDSGALKRLDAARSLFVSGPRVVLVTTEDALARLATDAPHIWSWIGSRVFSLDRDIGQLDVDARLASLRAGTGLTDDEVIRRAENRSLPLDPVTTEWLILLNRRDLIGP